MDKLTIDKISTLHPKIRQRVLDRYIHVNNKLLGKGVRLRFPYTSRDTKEQDEKYAQGRTKLYDSKGRRLGKITNAKGGQSIHEYHLAFDIVLLLDKDGDGNIFILGFLSKEEFINSYM